MDEVPNKTVSKTKILSKNPIWWQMFLITMGAAGTALIIACFIFQVLKPLGFVLGVSGAFLKLWPYVQTKKVIYKDECIIVSSFNKQETIAIENILEILLLDNGFKRIQIEFKTPSIHFGKIITYIPKKDIIVPFYKKRGIYLAPGMWIRKY